MEARATGVLLGLACGDALGRPVEGWPAERIACEYGRLTEFVGGGVHDRADFVSRLLEWYESGPFGIGGTTSEALRQIADGIAPLEGALSALPGDAPDDLLEDLAPVPNAVDPDDLEPATA
ncbi:ADP-ribosylglycohydrolase family protein [Natrialbaceae archaeon A-gly3]